jgi:hypothetical protein
MSESQKVKLLAIKLKKHIFIWWDNLKKHKECEGKKKWIVTWKKINELTKKFLLETYRINVFHKFLNFRQEGKLEHLMLWCDIIEQVEQTISCYFGGIPVEISIFFPL